MRDGARPSPSRATYTTRACRSSELTFVLAADITGSVGTIACLPGGTEDPLNFELEFEPNPTPEHTSGNGHPLAIKSGARTSTRIGAGPDRTCVTHAGSHVTARRTNSDPPEFDPLEKVAEISRSISCTAGDLSEPPLRPPTRVPLRGTDPTHRPRAAPVTGSSGTRRRRRDDAGFTSTIRSVAPALATPAANTIDSSNPSTIS